MANPTAQQLFEPTQSDYAIGVLKKLFGCTIDKLWSAGPQGTCTDSTLITDALSYFNLGCLILAGVVGTYLLYSLVADTANDGEVLGRSSDTKYTLLRAGVGGGLALPIANGLSVVQIVVLQLLIWGSGLGDRVWEKVSQSMIGSTAAQLTIDKIAPEMNSGLMASAAQALKTRIAGRVCAVRLKEVANALAAGNSGDVTESPPVDEPEYIGIIKLADVWEYRFAGGAFWNNDNNLCGEVHYRVPTSYAAQNGASVSDQVGSAVSTLVVNATQAAMDAGMQELQNQARSIGDSIVNNQRDATATSNAIKSALASVTNKVTDTLYQNIQQGLNSPKQNIATAINSSTQEGWMKAMLYQRLLTNSYSAVSSAFGGLTFGSTDPGTLSSYLSWSSYFGNSSSIYAPITAQYNSDIAYLQTFNNLFAALGSGAGSRSTGNGTGGTVLDSSMGTQISQAMLWVITPSTNYGTTWRDPIPDIARAGGWLTYLAGVAGGTSWAASLAKVGWVNDLGALSGYFAVILAGLAFVLAGLIPLLPLVYFIGGAISWLVVGLEAMIAAPLWLLTYFFPARDANLIGSSKQGFLLLTGVLVRPALIIIGLVGGMFIMRVGYDFLSLMFYNAFAAVSGTGGSWAGAGAGLTLILSILFVFVLAVLVLVMNCCSLITELGDAVLRWIDVNAQSLFAARFGSDVGGVMNVAQRGATSSSALVGGKGASEAIRQARTGRNAIAGSARPRP